MGAVEHRISEQHQQKMKFSCILLTFLFFTGDVKKSHSFYVNKFDVRLFNAIFDRRYLDAIKMLNHRKSIKPENTQPEELSEDLIDVTGDSRLPTDVSFWRKFGKMVRRIN